jgi:hypothetical protein
VSLHVSILSPDVSRFRIHGSVLSPVELLALDIDADPDPVSDFDADPDMTSVADSGMFIPDPGS